MSNKKLNGKTIDDKLEELAVMVAVGFADTVTKTEFNDFKGEMYGFRDQTNKRLFDLENDMRDLKRSLGELTERVNRFVAIVEAQQAEFRELRALIADLQTRVVRLETR